MALKIWLHIWSFFFCPSLSSPPLSMKMTLFNSLPLYVKTPNLFHCTAGATGDRNSRATTKLDVESLITYKRSLERQNKAFAKQIKKLKNVIISPFFYTSCSTSVAPVGQCSPRSTILQAEALCFKIYINAPQSSWQAEVWKSKHIQCDSKRWTQLRTSIFLKLHMVCEWST